MAVKSSFNKKLIHIGIVVRDMDKTIRRLEALGMGPFINDPPPKMIGKMIFRGKPYDPNIKVVFVKIGDVALELFENIKGESPWGEFLEKKGEGIHHIAFAETDIENESARLVKQGASVLHRVRTEIGGSDYLDLGIGGLIIELEQR